MNTDIHKLQRPYTATKLDVCNLGVLEVDYSQFISYIEIMPGSGRGTIYKNIVG